MDTKFVFILGFLAIVALIEITILASAERRRKRALAAAGPSQGLAPLPPGEPPLLALLPILEHRHHSWGQVLRGSYGSCEVLLFDYSYRVGKAGSSQTVAVFRSPAVSFPKFQLRRNKFLASAGWGAYESNRVKFDKDPEFNNAWLLTGLDPAALSNFFHSDLRGSLNSLADHSWTIEGFGDCLAFYRHGKKVKPDSLFEFVQSAGSIAVTLFYLAPVPVTPPVEVATP